MEEKIAPWAQKAVAWLKRIEELGDRSKEKMGPYVVIAGWAGYAFLIVAIAKRLAGV